MTPLIITPGDRIAMRADLLRVHRNPPAVTLARPLLARHALVMAKYGRGAE